MAINIKQQAEQMRGMQVAGETDPTKRIFTPEQSHILGESHRLILSWQLEPIISETSPAMAAKVEA
jgi:hypothetical protein